ncbi:MAG: photosynthetic reaction center cytochrome c subunit [Sphingomonas sp.]|nr:photosynthetic reaction center cytochrome c subunit [Sphingomonas sp.]
MIRVATTISTVVSGALVLTLAGCEFGPKTITQTGYRGTGGEQITANRRLVAQPVPAPPYELPADGGPTAGQTYENVKVLNNVSAERFNHLMAAMNIWVAPTAGDPAKVGCNYCHNPNNMASDEKYTKVVARRMIQMTLAINSQWSPHVKQTGVTCYTCHRGNAVPRNVWALADSPNGGGRIMGNKHGQNTPVAQTGFSSLPYDPFSTYLNANNNIRVQGATALRSATPGKSIASTEKTYALMMHLSSSLNVNCTFCHNSAQWAGWSQSQPQRVTAWYGLRMVKQVNDRYIGSLASVFPAYRKGPHGDVYKTNCATCHQGLNKPLGGVSMLEDYPYLKGAPSAPPVGTPPIVPPNTVPAVANGEAGPTATTPAAAPATTQ